MNVLHVIPSIAASDGGPSLAVFAFAEATKPLGIQSTIATTGTQSQEGTNADIVVHTFSRSIETYKVSLPLRTWLLANVRLFDLVHIHALFSFSSTIAARVAYATRVPYIVRPLGVLNRWGMENRRPWIKSLSLRLIERGILERASAGHFTSAAEMDEAKALLPSLDEEKLVVIPIPVALPKENVSPDLFFTRFPQAKGRAVILFLSRLDPKKGLELLLEAFDRVFASLPNAILVIAGSGVEDYVANLKASPMSLRNSARIIWAGHLQGELKESAMAAAHVFALPSASENFGIAAAEALGAGIPVVISPEVAISDLVRAADAGLVVQRDPTSIAKAIITILGDRNLADRFAERGTKLVAEYFSGEAVGRQLATLYNRIIGDKAEVRSTVTK